MKYKSGDILEFNEMATSHENISIVIKLLYPITSEIWNYEYISSIPYSSIWGKSRKVYTNWFVNAKLIYRFQKKSRIEMIFADD